MKRFQIIAFTHSGVGVDKLSTFHWEKERVIQNAGRMKEELCLNEIMYLSTCNRIEFIMVSGDEEPIELSCFLKVFNPDFSQEELDDFETQGRHWNGINAVNHLIEVASSLDSMVLGEREIITQVREAFDFAFANNLAGDSIRLAIQQTITTAKQIYTETDISKKPVSVVSLAFQTLVSRIEDRTCRILVVGSGRTNTNFCDFLQSFGFQNFTVFNRTLENAEKLAATLEGEAYSLNELKNYKKGFDILVTCTGSGEHIIDEATYQSLLNGEEDLKYVVDLSVPSDLNPTLADAYSVDHISVSYLKEVSEFNLQERRKELIKVRQIIYDSLEEFKKIFRVRQMTVRLREIPEHVKEIRKRATSEVFQKELDELDDKSKETLDMILDYMEKKYISVPMIMAKQFAENDPQNGIEE